MAIKVGVLRGGISNEHEVSLKTGENILANLPEKYSGHDILLTKNNDWIFNRQFSHPEKIFRHVDVIFNALHGSFGEDGKVQKIFEHFNMPYTGSSVFASAMGMNKLLSKNLFRNAGLNVPQEIVVDIFREEPKEIKSRVLKDLPPPWVVKPINGGSSVGVFIASNFDELFNALENQNGPKAIIEEYIRGREATCGVINNFRGKKYYALPVIEIIPPQHHNFFSYEAKYEGETKEICPGNFDREIKDEIEQTAKIAHYILGCRHYSREDFIISDRPSEKGKIYILEANTLPGLTKESLIPKALESVGVTYPQFLDHLITLALE